MVVGSNRVALKKTSDIAHVSSKEFLDIQAAECRFTLKRVCNMMKTHTVIESYVYGMN